MSVITAEELVDHIGSHIQILQRSNMVLTVLSVTFDATGRTVIVKVRSRRHGIVQDIAMPRRHGVRLIGC